MGHSLVKRLEIGVPLSRFALGEVGERGEVDPCSLPGRSLRHGIRSLVAICDAGLIPTNPYSRPPIPFPTLSMMLRSGPSVASAAALWITRRRKKLPM
jgi:hypothetical protein